MSNWDLMMPGMGLTAIGLAGVTISYAGIAHTFIDGMHALTGLTMFIGLIFLAAGILDGGVSTSNRAKATTLVVLGIALSFGVAAFSFTTISTLPVFAGVMLMITIPAIVIAYVAMKMPEYTKPISIIFILAVGAAITAYVGFGLYGPSPYLIPPPVVEEEIADAEITAPIFAISVLKDSALQGNPDYDPDEAQVVQGAVIVWTNDDEVGHTVTSADDAGDTFDSGLFGAGETYSLDTTELALGKYDYLCIVHPWMTASFEIIEPPSVPEVSVSILSGSTMQGNPAYAPDPVIVPTGSVIVWTNDDADFHTATSDIGSAFEFDSGMLAAGETYRLDTAGVDPGKYDYLCIVHPWMRASIEIVDDSGAMSTEGMTVTDSVPIEEVAKEMLPETPIQEPAVAVEGIAGSDTEAVQSVQTPESAVFVSVPTGTAVPGCEQTDQCYIPSTVTVAAGTTVTWTNDDTAAHTVTSGDLKTGNLNKFDSGLFMAGSSFSFDFETKGTYPYYCQVHPWMVGKVIVE